MIPLCQTRFELAQCIIVLGQGSISAWMSQGSIVNMICIWKALVLNIDSCQSVSARLIEAFAHSLGDGVDVVIVGWVDLSVVSQSGQHLVKFCLAQFLLSHIPDVALVDKLVRLGDLLHDFKNKLLAVTSVWIEAGVGSCVVVATSTHPGASSSLSTAIGLLTHKSRAGEDALFADAVGDKHLQQVVRHLVKFLNLLDMSAHDCFLFLEYADSAINFDIHQMPKKSGKVWIKNWDELKWRKVDLLVIKVLESNWDLILAFLVENDFKCACVVVDLKQGAHRLFLLCSDASHNDDLYTKKSLTIMFLCKVANHFNGCWKFSTGTDGLNSTAQYFVHWSVKVGKRLTSLIESPSISQTSSGLGEASWIIFRVTGAKTRFFLRWPWKSPPWRFWVPLPASKPPCPPP